MKELKEKQIEQLNALGKASAKAGETFAAAVKTIQGTLKPKWTPIILANSKDPFTDDTIILFDTGEIRRFGESDHPRSIITHYINL